MKGTATRLYNEDVRPLVITRKTKVPSYAQDFQTKHAHVIIIGLLDELAWMFPVLILMKLQELHIFAPAYAASGVVITLAKTRK